MRAVSGWCREALRDRRLALVSPYGPDARFTVGGAMGRNRLIYCLARPGTLPLGSEAEDGEGVRGRARGSGADGPLVAGNRRGGRPGSPQGAKPLLGADRAEAPLIREGPRSGQGVLRTEAGCYRPEREARFDPGLAAPNDPEQAHTVPGGEE